MQWCLQILKLEMRIRYLDECRSPTKSKWPGMVITIITSSLQLVANGFAWYVLLLSICLIDSYCIQQSWMIFVDLFATKEGHNIIYIHMFQRRPGSRILHSRWLLSCFQNFGATHHQSMVLILWGYWVPWGHWLHCFLERLIWEPWQLLRDAFFRMYPGPGFSHVTPCQRFFGSWPERVQLLGFVLV